MSSHHFVKDQQEPAVFILDADNLSFHTISPLLEWVPTVLVSEAALDQVMSWGIKIDVILATEEFQAENQHLLEEQYPVKFINTEENNFLTNGLDYLRSTDHKAAHLVGISHLKALELQDKLDLMNLTILDGDWKYYPVKSGVFKKWFAECNIHIHGKEGMPIQIQNENGELILPITYATILEVPEGNTRIKAPGIFWIGEQVYS
ncbi:thiamine pyrophosphokinase [Algoriphagus halophytocola]|uniref:Thiamine pyrophosphokinase n=1 Tax=Algoriphagus halophytocola TaxID=2991499 RepID=A0ABY6MEB9_9BACT|nr:MULTISPECIES: thiamine pyrophosphokinase [unclassified Algoriphagus]UZD21284.1 thiamine pyrophosphokinase [Algoriphagus sp. TR-M5]WBL42495.1 thiamine pyrophosphokinase [Algoriphagus sp. TR-M9]